MTKNNKPNMKSLAYVLVDSIHDDVRLTTLEIKLPRIVLAEFNTHRALSRNSANSRTIPIQKIIRHVMEDPYIPETWGKNGKGMQAKGELVNDDVIKAREIWLSARDDAVKRVRELLSFSVHKQRQIGRLNLSCGKPLL